MVPQACRPHQRYPVQLSSYPAQSMRRNMLLLHAAVASTCSSCTFWTFWAVSGGWLDEFLSAGIETAVCLLTLDLLSVLTCLGHSTALLTLFPCFAGLLQKFQERSKGQDSLGAARSIWTTRAGHGMG